MITLRKYGSLFLMGAAFLLFVSSSAYAARFPVGTKWKTLRASGVEVHYPEGYEYFAHYLAEKSSASIDTIQDWLDIRPRKARIILNPFQDDSGGLAIVGPLRVELGLTPILEKGLRPQAGIYLDRVAAHELTHVAQLSTTEGVTKYLRPVLGDVIAPVGLAPDWILEGQAIWIESRNGGGRYNSAYYKMLFRAALAEGKIWTLDQLATPGYVNPVLGRAYVGGTFLVGELARDIDGRQRLARWNREQARYPAFQRTAFKKSFSDRLPEREYVIFIRAQREWFRKLMLDCSNAGYASGVRMISAARTSFRYPTELEDGTVAASVESYDYSTSIVFYSPDGKMLKRTGNFPVSRLAHKGVSAFRNGVLFSQVRRSRWVPEANTSVVMAMSTSGKTHAIKRDGKALRGWAPVWTPAENKLAYVTRARNGGLALMVASLNESDEISGEPVVVFETALGMISDPAWSLDGKKLAFSADMGDGEFVYVWSQAADEFVQVRIANTRTTWDPCFSASGTLWVSADLKGIFNLCEVDLKSGEGVCRTRVLTGVMEPQTGRFGNHVWYSHYTAEGFATALLDSSRWLNVPVSVHLHSYSKKNLANKVATDGLVDRNEHIIKDYSLLSAFHPTMLLPIVGNDDEISTGAALYGRDPVGLVSWRLGGGVGQESGLGRANVSVTSHLLPVDVTAFYDQYPDELIEYSSRIIQGITEPSDTILSRGTAWRVRHEGGVTLHQRINLNPVDAYSSILPYGGWVMRERFGQRVDSLSQLANGGHFKSYQYQGVRLGIVYQRARQALREPVPGHLLYVSLFGERELLDASDITAKLLQGNIRFHHRGLLRSSIVEWRLAAQQQWGNLSFSRSAVRPRGFDDEHLPAELYDGKRIASLGTSLHFPLLLPDRGVGMGWLFVRGLYGEIFADASTGWGGGMDFDKWMLDYSVYSYGAALTLKGWGAYQAEIELSGGVAVRSTDQQPVFYIQLGLPELSGYLGR